MAVSSIAEIDRWSSGAVRQVAAAARDRASAAQTSADTLGALPAFFSWHGVVRGAAHTSISQTQAALLQHYQQALNVAAATETAAGQIDRIKQRVADLRSAAAQLGLMINPVTNHVTLPPGGTRSPLLMAAALRLQTQLIAAIADANRVDGALTEALTTNTPAKRSGIQLVDHHWKQDPTTTTTTTTTPPPECKSEDVAKLMNKIEEWNRRDEDLTRRIIEHNRKKRDFDLNDPVQVRQAAEYQAEGDRLQVESDKLKDDRRKLINDAVQCGAKLSGSKLDFPDGTTTPTPTPSPSPTPSR